MIKRLLVPLDGSGLAERALPLATAIASHSGAELLLLSAVVPSEQWAGMASPASESVQELAAAKAYLDSVAEPLSGHGIKVRTLAVSDRAAPAICGAAESGNVDMIVIATHGRSGLGTWYAGSVADRVRRTSDVPVLLVHARRETTPRITGIECILVPIDGSEASEAVVPIASDLANALEASLLLARIVPSVQLTRLLANDIRAHLERVAERAREQGVKVELLVQAGDPVEALLEIARDQADLIAMTTNGTPPGFSLTSGSVADAVSRAAQLPCLMASANTHLRGSLDARVTGAVL
ncbi:MAG: universal stress protein [Chloroflexota bacterium]